MTAPIPRLLRHAPPRSRWRTFLLVVLGVYTAQCACLWVVGYGDTWLKWAAMLPGFALLHLLATSRGRNPLRLALAYLALLPIALLLQVASNFVAHPGYVFPTERFVTCLLFLGLPVLFGIPGLVLRGRSGAARGRAGWLAYLFFLFLAQGWRLPNEYIIGAYTHHEFSVHYFWLGLILPQMLCMDIRGRTRLRRALCPSRFLLSRTAGGFLLGWLALAAWTVAYDLLLIRAGFARTISIRLLGANDMLASDVTLPSRLLMGLAMKMTSNYLFVALGEEAFFRQVLPEAMMAGAPMGKPGRGRIIGASLAAAALFATMHWFLGGGLRRTLYLFGFALILTLVRRRAGNLQAGTLAHAALNILLYVEWKQ